MPIAIAAHYDRDMAMKTRLVTLVSLIALSVLGPVAAAWAAPTPEPNPRAWSAVCPQGNFRGNVGPWNAPTLPALFEPCSSPI